MSCQLSGFMLVVPPTLFGGYKHYVKISKRRQCLILPLHAVNDELFCDILGITIKSRAGRAG